MVQPGLVHIDDPVAFLQDGQKLLCVQTPEGQVTLTITLEGDLPYLSIPHVELTTQLGSNLGPRYNVGFFILDHLFHLSDGEDISFLCQVLTDDLHNSIRVQCLQLLLRLPLFQLDLALLQVRRDAVNDAQLDLVLV